MEGSGPRPGPFLADRLEGSPLHHDRARRRLEGLDARVPALGRRAAVGERRADERGRAGLPQEQPRVVDAGDRRAARLCVVWHARSRRLRFQWRAGVASQARRSPQLSRQRRLSGALQGPHLHLPGSQRQRHARVVRRRVQHPHRRRDLENRSAGIRRVGNACGRQHGRPRRAHRQQSVPGSMRTTRIQARSCGGSAARRWR